MSDLHIIGNTICPFSQRVRILLEDTGMAHEWVELDFTDKPDWFMALTPLGKVPVLVCQGQSVFESGAILEFIHELSRQRHLPVEPLARAQIRSWGAFANRLHEEARAYFTARTEVDMEVAADRLGDLLAKLPAQNLPLFIDGGSLTLAGVHLAPLFILLKALSAGGDPGFFPLGSPLDLLGRQLLALPSVARVDSDDYRMRFTRFVLAPDTAYARQRRALRGAEAQASAEHAPNERQSERYLSKAG